MNTRITILPLSLVLTASAFAQAGVEGDPRLLAAPPARPTQAPAPTQVASALPGVTPAFQATSATAPAVPAAAPSAPKLKLSTARNGKGNVSDYDFGEVVQTVNSSMQPLAGEIRTGFPTFVDQIGDAIALMEAGRNQEAVALSAQAVDGVLAARDSVVNPLWDAQFFLNEQVAIVRSRLALSLTTNDPSTPTGKATQRSTATLDQLASQIAKTKDPARKKRLTAHYRTMRKLTEVNAKKMHMTPDQRKLWLGMLTVLEHALQGHEQVLMQAETLFATLDGNSSQLHDYLGVLQTTKDIEQMFGVNGGGMQGFVEGMKTLQEQMDAFAENMQSAIDASMADLESRVETMQTTAIEGTDAATADGTVAIDEELQARINRVAPTGAGKD